MTDRSLHLTGQSSGKVMTVSVKKRTKPIKPKNKQGQGLIPEKDS